MLRPLLDILGLLLMLFSFSNQPGIPLHMGSIVAVSTSLVMMRSEKGIIRTFGIALSAAAAIIVVPTLMSFWMAVDFGRLAVFGVGFLISIYNAARRKTKWALAKSFFFFVKVPLAIIAFYFIIR